MSFLRRNLKRIATDAAGYLLLVLAVASSPLPGPGGIPLALAGLGLLSINNVWAQRLRDYLLKNGGKVVQFLFPNNRLIQWLYDILALVLLVLVAVLAWRHEALWQISLAVILFCASVFLALMNRDRLRKLQHKA